MSDNIKARVLMLKGEKGDKGDNDYKPAVDKLEKRLDNLILSSGTESSAEVIDARNGYDGTSYDTLGTAIRKQVSELKGNLADLQNGGYVADQQQIEQKVKSWLDEHPEATTTVQDGSLTYAKTGTELRNQTVHIVCDKTGDITDLIRNIVKSNRHIRFYGCNAITNSVSFSDLQNVTLEFVNSKIMFCYDHDVSNKQIAFEFSDCENICVKGLNITTDYSDTNDINLNIQGLYNNNLYGIWLHNVNKSSIVNCNISQFTDGLSVNYCNNVDVYKCRLYNIGQEPAVFRNCSQCSMTFCEAYWHGGDGTIVKHWDSDAISGFVFADNYFHDGKIVTSSGGNIICGGGFTSNVEGNDTILRNPEYIIVRNNKFIDTEYGVLLAGGSHIIVDGNLIKSKVKEDGNYYTYAALGLDYSAYNLPDVQNYADIKFINNTVERASRGIYIAIKSTESVTITHEDILISGNIIKNCKNEAIETHNSLIVGNRFENVQISMIYDSLFVGNLVSGTDEPINEYCRFQVTNCDVLSNKFDMGKLYFDVRNTENVSISGNTFNSCQIFRVESTSGYVYLEKNTFFSEPTYRFINGTSLVVVDGKPYNLTLTEDTYYSYIKCGNVVELDFTSSQTPALSTAFIELGTLPEGYRPLTTFRHLIYTNPSSGAYGELVRIEITTSGVVKARANTSVSGAPIRGTLTFITGG